MLTWKFVELSKKVGALVLYMCVCVCVKLLSEDLNPGPYPPYSTNTYTCEVTVALRVCGNWITIPS